MNQTDEFAILRVPILYGDVETLTESSVTSIYQSMLASNSLILDHWGICYPTLVDDIAVVCRQMIEYKNRSKGFNGVFHWSGSEALTKFDMAKTIVAKLSWHVFYQRVMTIDIEYFIDFSEFTKTQ